MSRLKEIREARAAAHAKAVEFLKVNPQTAESRSSYDAAMKEVDTLGEDIVRIEKADKVEAELRAGNVGTRPVVADVTKTVEQRVAEYRTAWVKALKTQSNFTSGSTGNRDGKSYRIQDEELRRAMDSGLEFARESRDMSEGNIISQIGTYSGIGYFVPAGFVYDVEQATKYFCPMLDGSVCRVLETATGQPLPYPTSNDTNQVATVIGENTTVNEQDASAGHINFGAWKLTSGLAKVSLELLQDSAFDLQAWLVNLFGIRYGRGLEALFTTGTGVNQPTGLLTAIAASGATPVVATGSATNDGSANTGANSIGSQDLVTLEHAVDPTYRRGAKYMFHDTTLGFIKKLLDKFGRPLWAPGISANDPDRVNGYSYVINQSMPEIGASNTTMIFGDFSKFMIRKVKDLSVLRLDERFADAGQVGFVSFARVDSNLLDAGTHPLNVLQQHS